MLGARRWIGSLVAGCVLLTAAPAAAAPALETTKQAIPKGPSRSHYEVGLAAFEAEDYAKAGAEWAATLDGIPEGPKLQTTRAQLILDIISAYTLAYEKSGEVSELETGLEHYFRYFALYEVTYGNPRIPRPVVEARYALRDRIREAKAGASSPAVTPEPEPEPEPSAAPQPSARSIAITPHGMSVSDRKPAPLIPIGAVVLGLGVGASSMIAIGSIGGRRARKAQHDDDLTEEDLDAIDQRGRTMNAVFIAGLVATPVLIGAGATLLGVGLRRKRRGVHAVVPAATRNFAGLTVRGRF